MLEPDVALTDVALAVECVAFAVVLRRRRVPDVKINRLFAILFGSLAASSVLGAFWHGVFSDVETALGALIWFGVLAALALAAFILWRISAALSSSLGWARAQIGLGLILLGAQITVSAFFTDRFAVAALGMLPPLCVLNWRYATLYRQAHSARALYGVTGLSIAALAGLIIMFDVTLHPAWATTNAVYHAVQFVAFWLVFLSVPALRAQPR